MPDSAAAPSRATSRRSSRSAWRSVCAFNIVARFVAAACAVALVGAAPAAPVVAVRPQTTGEPWRASDVAALRADLDALLARDPAVRGAHVGVLALDTHSGTVLYERNAGDEFQPASTLKLLVGSVALEKLGPGYAFETSLSRAGNRLVVRAGGDPLLASSDLDAAAAAVVASGLSGAGSLTVDASHFVTPPYPAGWVWDDFGYDYAAPVSAAALDENVRTYAVLPGAAVGQPVRVLAARAALVLDARCPGFVNRAVTAEADAPATLDTVTETPQCTALVGALPLAAAGGSASANEVVVPVADPSAYFGAQLAALLAPPVRDVAVRIEAGGAPGPASAPASVIWRHDSAPLRAWLGPRFWIPSDNFVAEQLLCEVGFVGAGAPGSTARGLDVERAWLRANGIDPATATLADGSGLSQYDRITPRALVAILQHDWNGPNRELVLDSLPIGGVRGTIEGLAGTAAAGRVYAKTGSMSHVRGLAGYLATARHGAVTFAFEVDDWNGDYAPLAALRAEVLVKLVDS